MLMTIINLFEIDTVYGFKAVELHHADLTDLSFNVDLLVLSAFKNNYVPTNGTLIGSLFKNRAINVQELAVQPAIDLRDSMGVWLSKPIDVGHPYHRIACIEMMKLTGGKLRVEQSVKNLFSLISIGEMQDIHFTSLAMPIIGSGQQGILPEDVLEVLMPISLKALYTIPRLQKIIFVEYTAEKVKILNQAMNKHLARKESDVQSIPENSLSNAILQDVAASLKKLKMSLGQGDPNELTTIDEFLMKLQAGSLRFFELGLLSRRLCELVVKDILEVKRLKDPLYLAIDGLKEKKKISGWIISYLHTLRIFGNEAAHEKGNTGYVPAQIHQQDLLTILFFLNRVLDFWIWYRFKRNSSSL